MSVGSSHLFHVDYLFFDAQRARGIGGVPQSTNKEWTMAVLGCCVAQIESRRKGHDPEALYMTKHRYRLYLAAFGRACPPGRTLGARLFREGTHASKGNSHACLRNAYLEIHLDGRGTFWTTETASPWTEPTICPARPSTRETLAA